MTPALEKLLAELEQDVDSLDIYGQVCISAVKLHKAIEIIRVQSEALEFYKSLATIGPYPQMIEATINGGEYVKFGTIAASSEQKIEELLRG